MRHLRAAALVALVVGTLITSAGTALAAPPGNDTYGGRTVIGATPFTDSLDTTEATTDSDDTDIGPLCGALPTDASVWYEITPTADSTLRLEMSLSTYATGAIVATGSPGNWSLVGCTGGGMRWTATAGTTYTVIIRDDQSDGSGNGGTLNLTIDVPPPLPTADITVNPVATFNPRTGSATVSGTWTCTGGAPSTIVRLTITLTQQAGPLIVSGRGSAKNECDSTPRPWSMEVVSTDGSTFHGGKAATSMNWFVCGPTGCAFPSGEGTIQLRGGAPA
jgi:hypothetical protein